MPASGTSTTGHPIALVAASVLASVAASLFVVDVARPAAERPADQPVAAAPATATGTTSVAPATGAVRDGSTTPVAMSEFAFDMPATFQAGTHTSEVTNTGVAPHEFALGAVGDHAAHLAQTTQMSAGATETITVELGPGTYEVGCHVPGHLEAGMRATITVLP